MLIGSLSAATGISRSTIRYYERIRLIKAEGRRENRYKEYPEAIVDELRFIHKAKTLGFKLAEIRSALKSMRATTLNCHQIILALQGKLLDVDREMERLRSTKRDLKQELRYFEARKAANANKRNLSAASDHSA